jgi:hypothetical protein
VSHVTLDHARQIPLLVRCFCNCCFVVSLTAGSAGSGLARRSPSPQHQKPSDIAGLVKKLKGKGVVVYTREENVTDNIDWDTIAGYDDIKKVGVCNVMDAVKWLTA